MPQPVPWFYLRGSGIAVLCAPLQTLTCTSDLYQVHCGSTFTSGFSLTYHPWDHPPMLESWVEPQDGQWNLESLTEAPAHQCVGATCNTLPPFFGSETRWLVGQHLDSLTCEPPRGNQTQSFLIPVIQSVSSSNGPYLALWASEQCICLACRALCSPLFEPLGHADLSWLSGKTASRLSITFASGLVSFMPGPLQGMVYMSDT